MTKEFTLVPEAEQVTDEMIDAVDMVRAAIKGAYRLQPEVRSALSLLDRAGFFTPVDEATARDEELSARMMAGLRGIDLDDRYPVGDENGIIRSRREGD